MNNTHTTGAREIWIDWLRVIACFMVFVVHSTEPFYLGGEGSLILTKTDAIWSSFFDSFVRSCVPLFIIASSYLMFPLKYSASEFFKRRAVRILIPFILWTVVYAFVWGEPATNFKNLLLNFNYAAGHLWFVYMLLGVYLLMPLLSPWAEKVEKKELQIYLGIWLFTTLIPLMRDWFSGFSTTVIYGPSGLPRQALFPLWGEASWNGYGTFYYMSGFIGYLLLGLYFRKFVGELSWKKTLAIAVPCYLAGFAITFVGFIWRVNETAAGVFPVGGLVEKAVWWETTWCNDTIGVALMAIAWILLIKKIKADGKFYQKVLLPVSKASYGMYLMHLLILVPICGMFRNMLGSGAEGILGVWTTPVEILASAAVAFVCTAIVSVIIRRIPKIGEYIV
jgi:surface polysaccharide O-acyltransferase-like enzyme